MILTILGCTPASRNSVVPPMRKQWPVMHLYPCFLHISLHLEMKTDFESIRKPEGELYAKREDEEWLMLTDRCLFKARIGSIAPT